MGAYWSHRPDRRTPGDRRARQASLTGWVGFATGTLTGLALALLAIHLAGPTAANCYEDEVAVWDGATDAHTTCIPLDTLATRP